MVIVLYDAIREGLNSLPLPSCSVLAENIKTPKTPDLIFCKLIFVNCFS